MQGGAVGGAPFRIERLPACLCTGGSAGWRASFAGGFLLEQAAAWNEGGEGSEGGEVESLQEDEGGLLFFWIGGGGGGEGGRLNVLVFG